MLKRPGRPPLDPDDESVQVGLSLPAHQYDRYSKRALAEDVSVAEVIRRELRERQLEGGKKKT